MGRTVWPERYVWIHDYALAKQDAVSDYKESWDAIRYFVHGKIFALLVRNRDLTLLNLKCEPFLSLSYRERYPAVLPGWHMNKLHWVSVSLQGLPPENICTELVDMSYDLVWSSLPKRITGLPKRGRNQRPDSD